MLKSITKLEERTLLDEVDAYIKKIISDLSDFEYRNDGKNRLLMQIRFKASEILEIIEALRK